MANPVMNSSDAPGWSDFILNFDKTYNAFMANYQGLLAVGPYVNSKHPELIPTYDRMVSEGTDHYNNLLALKETRDYAASWLNWFQSGAQGVFDWIGRQVGLGEFEDEPGLGLAPMIWGIVGLGTAVAALAVIASAMKEYYLFAQRLNLLQEYERRGMSPQEASAAVNSALGEVGGGLFGIPWNFLIWGAVAIFLGPPIIKALTGGRD